MAFNVPCFLLPTRERHGFLSANVDVGGQGGYCVLIINIITFEHFDETFSKTTMYALNQ